MIFVCSVSSYCHLPSVRQSGRRCFTVPCLDLWVCLATVRRVGVGLLSMLLTHPCSPNEVCDYFSLEWLSSPLRSRHPQVCSVKEESLCTSPEIAKQSVMVKNGGQTRAGHGCVATMYVSQQHGARACYSAQLFKQISLGRVYSCLLLEWVVE